MLHMHIRSFETRYLLKHQPFRYQSNLVLTVDSREFELPPPYDDTLDGLLDCAGGRAFEVILHVEKEPKRHGLRLQYLAQKDSIGRIHGHWSVTQDFYDQISEDLKKIGVSYQTCELRAFHEGHTVKSESPLEILIDYEIDDISFPSRFDKGRYITTREIENKSVGLVSKTLIRRYE